MGGRVRHTTDARRIVVSGKKRPETDAQPIVIFHDKLDDYADWLEEIERQCEAAPGYQDLQVVRPIAGLTYTYTIIVRFDSQRDLEAWMGSPERKAIIDKVQPLLATHGDFFLLSGLDFWFTPDGANDRVPPAGNSFWLPGRPPFRWCTGSRPW
jgi:hypothetical protein